MTTIGDRPLDTRPTEKYWIDCITIIRNFILEARIVFYGAAWPGLLAGRYCLEWIILQKSAEIHRPSPAIFRLLLKIYLKPWPGNMNYTYQTIPASCKFAIYWIKKSLPHIPLSLAGAIYCKGKKTKYPGAIKCYWKTSNTIPYSPTMRRSEKTATPRPIFGLPVSLCATYIPITAGLSFPCLLRM